MKKKSYSKKHFIDGSIVTVPDTEFKKYDVVVVYGGLHYATPKWMLEQVSKNTPELLFSNIFVFVPYSVSLETTESIIRKALAGKQAKAYSLIGFSKGGENVVLSKNYRKWRFVGLIDPSIGWNYVNRSWGKETHFTYGSKEMMDIYEKNGGRYSKLKAIVKKGGGHAEKSVTNHKTAPANFFTQFRKKINHGA